MKSKLVPFAAAAFAAICALPLTASAAEKFVFAWTPNPQTPQVDVALAKGYFKDAGLDMKLVAFASGREGFEALIGGQVDVTFMAEFPAAIGILRGQKFGIVGDLARFRGSRIIGNGKVTQLKSPKDLAGLKLGTTLGTNVDFYLKEVLAKAGVKATVVNASPGDLVPALVRGDVAAATMFPTFYGVAKKALGANYRELRSSAYSPHFILAASDSILTKRPKVLQAFIGALAKADADVKANPSAAQDAVLKNLKAAMPKDALAAMWKDVEIGMVLNKELFDLLKAQTAWIVKQGKIKANVPTDATIRAAFADGPLKAANAAAVSLP